MSSSGKSKPSWASRFGFGSRKATASTPKIEKSKPVQKAYVERLEVNPANTYSGRFGQIHETVVVTKPPPVVIRVIPNRPRVRDVSIIRYDAPPRSRLAPRSTAPPEQSLTTPNPNDRNEMELNREGAEARPRFIGERPEDQGRSIPELIAEELNNLMVPTREKKQKQNLPTERCTIQPIENRINIPTKLHINPQVEQPIPPTEPAPIHPPIPRGLKADYLKNLWEHDLLRNPQSAPSVVSVSTVDTCIFDRPVSAAASFIPSETDDDESTTGSFSVSTVGTSIYSIASVVTCIYNPYVAAAVPSTPCASDTLVGGVNREARALMPSEDPVLVRKSGDKDDWLHAELYDQLHTELHGYLDSTVEVKDRSSDACSAYKENTPGCCNGNVRDRSSDACSVYEENTPGCWNGNVGDWSSENYSFFQENTPSECAGKVESQATDNNFDQQIGIATTSPSDQFGPQIASTELQNVLPAINGGGADSLSGWPLQDNDNFEFTIEDGRSVCSLSPLLEQSPACQNNSRPQVPELAFQALGEPLDPVATGNPTRRLTESLLPETANQINSVVENGCLANPTSPPLEVPRTSPRFKRWLHSLGGSKDAQYREERLAWPRRWYLLRDESDST